jgi:ATP-binding cassette subfamily F protein uup
VKIDVKTERLGGKVIEARNLTKSFGTPAGDLQADRERLQLLAQAGDRIGIVGPNGIGKSTFIDLLTGKLPARRRHRDHGRYRDPRHLRPARACN